MALDPQAVVNFFIDLAADEGGTITPMKAQKLVYYAHGWCLAQTGEPLINEQVEAWPYGPVIPSLYSDLKKYGNNPIKEKIVSCSLPGGPDDDDPEWYGGDWGFNRPREDDAGFNRSVDLSDVTPSIPDDDSEDAEYYRSLLRRIWKLYGRYSGTQLSNMTHEPDGPWDQVRQKYHGVVPRGTDIPEDVITKYFRKVAGW